MAAKINGKQQKLGLREPPHNQGSSLLLQISLFANLLLPFDVCCVSVGCFFLFFFSFFLLLLFITRSKKENL